MNGIEKKVNKILQSASRMEESEFQREPQYLKFKSIKLKSSHNQNIKLMINQFRQLKFLEEPIYWYKRLLEITDMCNKEEQWHIYRQIVILYYNNKNFQKVLEYGNKAILNLNQTNLHVIKKVMGQSLMALKRYEAALSYLNTQNFDFMIKDLNDGSLTPFEFFYNCHGFVECQLKNRFYSNALEMSKGMKTFKMDSMNSKDVMKEYKKFVDENSSKYDRTVYIVLSLVVKTCISKCEIFAGLRDLIRCHSWAQTVIKIFQDLHSNVKNCGNDEVLNILQPILSRVIYTFLSVIQPVCDTSERQDYFKMLFFELFFAIKGGPCQIGIAMEYHSIDIEDVLPFLQFSIKYCSSEEALVILNEKGQTLSDPADKNCTKMVPANFLLDKFKQDMVKLKNSILINFHFKVK